MSHWSATLPIRPPHVRPRDKYCDCWRLCPCGRAREAQGDAQIAFSQYEKRMRPFADKNQALAKLSAGIMKGSFYSVWLYRLVAIMPAKVLLFFKNLGLKRTTRAANALILKEYMDKEVLNNEFYNAYAENFDKIPFEDILMPLMLKYLPKARCNLLEGDCEQGP